MALEEGEQLKLCPAKVAREERRVASHHAGTPTSGPAELVRLLIGKDDPELACLKDCPLQIGTVSLPGQIECPAESAG